MKVLLKFLAAALIITIVPMVVWATDIPLDPDYGTELNITTDYQFPKFDRIGSDMFKLSKLIPIWSPDGQSIAFSSGERLWIVSSQGGNAKMLKDCIYEKNGRSIVIGFEWPIAFTKDGKEVIVAEEVFDENRGAVINVTENSYSFSKPTWDIFAVNIETCESRLIASNGYLGSLSNDGKYLCYLNFDWKSNYDELQTDHHRIPKILNLETGESWFLSDDEAFFKTLQPAPIISNDNSYVIFQVLDIDFKTKIFQIPFNGGIPAPYIFYDGTAIGENVLSGINMSSDGKWTLYSSNNYNLKVEDAVLEYDENGNATGGFSFAHNVTRQCVYNNVTGENYYLLPPNPYVTTSEGKFSPGGNKFCYVLRDDYNRDKFYRIFVKDFDVNKLEKISVISAVQANGPEQFNTIKNYPNPFNPTTTIEFNLTKPENVNLSIYNLTGQKVCELASGEMTPGKHSYVWNGRDSKGTPVSSGIFFTRLETRDNVISNRMMLVK